MRSPEQERWILAFDAECGACREISRAVAQASKEKLEVMPLTSPEVRSWREQALGSSAPWAPTLMQIRSTGVRVWTRRGIVLPLMRRLGPRSTVRVVCALGELRQRKHELRSQPSRRHTMTRSQFLRLTTGLAAASGIVLMGKTPAFAAGETTEARSWVAANQGRLPRQYDDLITYPMAYRKEIWKASSPRLRSQWWSEQLRRYRSAHHDLTAEQNAVIDQTMKLAAEESTFDFEQTDRTDLMRHVERLAGAATETFGIDEAHALFGTLGPSDQSENASGPTMPGCNCNHDQEPGLNWCGWRDCIYYVTEACAVYCCDCGFLLLARCDGRCL